MCSTMEAELKSALNVSTCKYRGSASGGCIHEGKIYVTEKGPIFVKISKDPEAKSLFEGEMAGLRAIINTLTFKAPTPIKIVELSKGTCLVMEYLELSPVNKLAEDLGNDLARMHLHNFSLKMNYSEVHKLPIEDSSHLYVDKFGFDCPTYCGRIAQDNSWKEDWVEFMAQNRLDPQVRMVESTYGDREVRELWSELSLKLPEFFTQVEVVPSLLHGDLWSGNAASCPEGVAVFDPAAFYGHDEYELAIMKMFGGFHHSLLTTYHSQIVKRPGYEKRQKLYQLFHYLNHWNHFGTGYRNSSISIMKSLLKKNNT